MTKIIISVLLACLPMMASAGYYDGVDAFDTVAGTTTRTVSGGFAVAASTKTWRNFVTRIDGTRGITSSLQITASSITATSPLGLSASRLALAPGVSISSAPAAQYGGVALSSNVYVPSGAFYYGDASKLTAITAANISAGALGASVIASSHAVASVQDSAIVAVSGSKVSGNISGNAATATKLATARTINGISFDGSANINIATTSYLADGVSLALTGATFSAKSSSVTLQGNTFNGASQLVKLDALSKLPAVDGSQLLNLPSTSGGAVLAATQTFTGGNTFQSSSTFSGSIYSGGYPAFIPQVIYSSNVVSVSSHTFALSTTPRNI